MALRRLIRALQFGVVEVRLALGKEVSAEQAMAGCDSRENAHERPIWLLYRQHGTTGPNARLDRHSARV
jgi:hypothetical protein